ncbi:hypothetical protein L3Y34_000927 [Caenorhabditis briggsae]|uniref:Condensin complex subunit 1 C-terminal domain-containing protein n=2 Tax=Caenorhabditis briggsae TaxID=6238 RepID=A0AAE9DB77_CAEBR|nr:hypothetical protein L3Y34_000927 [Caenorhabditis briggsae]
MAVHGGACAKFDPSIGEDCSYACGTGTVESALTDLERIEKFNCGFGSHLTIDQEVECEASFMSSKNMSFGAVGAISNVFHPSKVARHLASNNWWKQRDLLHPLILVGRGAEKYAVRNDFPTCNPEELISNQAKDSYEKYLHRMLHPYDTHDTVGAISINVNNMEAESATSSGGIVLKHSGRLGHSCVYGSGTWSERRQYEEPGDLYSERTISIVSTGHGEHLVKADFCRGIATRVLDDEEGILYSDIIREFLRDKMESRARFGGIAMIADKFNERMSLEFLVFHNTRYLPAAVRGRDNKIQVDHNMPPKKHKKPVDAPPSPSQVDIADLQSSKFKLIAELIAETDQNLPDDEIDQAIEEFASSGDHSEWQGIEKAFPYLCSMARRSSTYGNWRKRFQVVDYLLSCFQELYTDVSSNVENYFDQKTDSEPDVEIIHAVSMFVILASKLIVQLQLHVSKVTAESNQGKRGGGRRDLDEETAEYCARWKNYQRNRIIGCLIQLLELRVDTAGGLKKKAIQYIFAPDAMEKDFIARFMDTVSQLLEDPENAARSSQAWIVSYFEIWKVLATEYQMAPYIANSIFGDTLDLPYLETASSFPFIEPIVRMMKDNSAPGRNRINQPLRALLEMCVRRACSVYSGDRAEHPPPKAFCMIIQALALHCPDVMLQEVNNVVRLLENPHVNVRMATLQALADMFASPYLSKELCEEFKTRIDKRKIIFTRLCAHVIDEGTNVRTKSISLLRSLMENRRIPEEFESLGFLTLVAGRLNDKSVQVRKAAIQFLTSFLDNNRHGHDFSKAVHVNLMQEKRLELLRLNTPKSRAIQQAEDEYMARDFRLKTDIRHELTGIFKGEVSISREDDIIPLAILLTDLDRPGVGAGLARFYASQENFPCNATRRNDLPDHGLELLDEAVRHVHESGKLDYQQFKLQILRNNDDQLLEDEQEARDHKHKVQQLRAQMQQLINKMLIGLELEKALTIALRCVLMGETAEIKEGIKFLTRCKLFGIAGADDAMRSMCSLVWRPHADVLNELIEAAEDMFISKLEGGEKAAERDKSTVENLMSAMDGVAKGDQASVEEVVYLLASKELPSTLGEKNNKAPRKRRPMETSVIIKLWHIALDTSIGNDNRKLVALKILFPISRTEKGLPEARSRLRSLQRKLDGDPKIAVAALRIISILGGQTEQEKEADAFKRPIFRIHQDDSLFKSIENFFFREVVKADDSPDRDWFGVVRYTVHILLNISMDANIMLPRLASHFLYRAKRISEFFIFYSKQAEGPVVDPVRTEAAIRRRDYWGLTWCRVMEKLMAFIGEVASQVHAYTQITIPRLHTRYISKMRDAEKSDSKLREESVRFLTDLEKSIAQKKTIFALPPQDNTQAATTDHYFFVKLLCDKRLFIPSKLLGRLLPIVVYGMRVKTMPTRIKQAATIAFAKFMPLSSEIASFGAPSFFGSMVNSNHSLIRCNMIASCCDFAFAQPTIFELYAPNLFKMSQDKSADARESALLVLTHLMSNDMIQTRGVLSESARCICDTARPVREAAQSLFRDLNARSETVVQLLPEFLYRLSVTSERLSMKQYKTVFEFLIALLKEKSRTTDLMIDRVCLKFSNIDMNDTEAPKYLLIALAKFAQNEGGLARLHDNWRHWSKFLCHSQVAREYVQMIEHMQSVSKNEDYKSQCSELIASIKKVNEEGLRKEDITAAPQAAKKKGRGRKAAAAGADTPSTSAARTPRRKRGPTPSYEESEYGEQMEEDEREEEEEEVEEVYEEAEMEEVPEEEEDPEYDFEQ